MKIQTRAWALVSGKTGKVVWVGLKKPYITGQTMKWYITTPRSIKVDDTELTRISISL